MNSELLSIAMRRAQWAKLTPPTSQVTQEELDKITRPLHARIAEQDMIIDNLRREIRGNHGIITRQANRLRELEKRPAPKPTPEPRRRITGRGIIDAVCAEFEISYVDILSIRRQSAITGPRQVAAYLMRHHTSLSMPQIGFQLGGRDHTTMMHAVSAITMRRQLDPELNTKIDEIEQRLRAAMETEL